MLDFLGQLIHIMYALCAVYALWHYRSLPRELKLVALFLVYNCVHDWFRYLSALIIRNNLYVAHYDQPLRLAIVGLFFYWVFPKHSRYRKFTLISVSLAILGMFVITATSETLMTFPNKLFLFSYPVIIILNLVFFLYLLEYPYEKKIERIAAFWFSMGTLFFHAVQFFYFAYSDYIIGIGKSPPKWMHMTLAMSIFVYYPLLTYALYVDHQNRKLKLDHARI